MIIKEKINDYNNQLVLNKKLLNSPFMLLNILPLEYLNDSKINLTIKKIYKTQTNEVLINSSMMMIIIIFSILLIGIICILLIIYCLRN